MFHSNQLIISIHLLTTHGVNKKHIGKTFHDMDIFIAYSKKSTGCDILMVLDGLQNHFKQIDKFVLKEYSEVLMANKTIGGQLSDLKAMYWDGNYEY